MTSHLTIEELIDGAREHGDCQRCRDAADAWAKVREGVRLRDDAIVPPAGVLESALAELDQPPASKRFLKPLSAAAALVVLAAGGYGVATALGHGTDAIRPGPGSTSAGAEPGRTGQTTAFTSTGCTGLELAGGTLTRTSGNDLVITASDRSQLTVTTTSTTAIYRETIGTLGDITDGERVVVTGTDNGGTITATSVGVLPDSVTSPATPSELGGLGLGLAAGTVTQGRNGEFTITEADGAQVAVTTSKSVTVITAHRITVAQLATGEATSAVGTEGAAGTLEATTVEQDAVPAATWRKLSPQPPTTPTGLPTIRTPAKPAISLNGLGCSPAAITTAYLLDGHL